MSFIAKMYGGYTMKKLTKTAELITPKNDFTPPPPPPPPQRTRLDKDSHFKKIRFHDFPHIGKGCSSITKALTAAAGMLFILTAFTGCDNSASAAKSTEKSITSFSFTQALNSNLSAAEVDGVIDESGKTISVQVNGNALPNLIATFSMSAGAKVEVAGVPQESGVTSNNFSNPVTYTVTAEDGSTEAYVVSVTSTVAVPGSPSSPAGITSASVTGGTVTISWEAPADLGIGNDGNPAAITKYKLYRSETAGFALTDAGVVTKEITDAALREFEVPGLTETTEYYFKLTAFNSIGEGSPTDEFNAFTPTDGLAFTLINADTEYSVTSGTVINTATAIIVPAYYEGKEVTALGANIFHGFSQLVSIQLPDGLKTIGDYAFRNCASLAPTSLPNGLTTIGQNAFANCTSLALTSLPDGLTTIGPHAFNGCSSLALTSLPDTVTDIGYTAFANCTSLALTSLPDGLTTIGREVFYECSSLALTSLPDGLTSIGNYAFKGCSSLALTSLPDTVTDIGTTAFASCTSLALTSLPDALTTIESYLFFNCTNLALTSLPDTVTSIRQHAFLGCTKLALTSLPDGVTSIGDSAFSGCTGLTEITINRPTPPTAGTEILKDCTNLTKIKVPSANVADYQTASGWSTYSAKIRAI